MSSLPWKTTTTPPGLCVPSGYGAAAGRGGALAAPGLRLRGQGGGALRGGEGGGLRAEALSGF